MLSTTRECSNPILESSSEDAVIAEYNKILENAALPKSNTSKKEKERKSMNTMTNFINKFNFGAVSNDVVKMTLYGPAFATAPVRISHMIRLKMSTSTLRSFSFQ